MDTKTCNMWNIDKHNNNCYRKRSECKDCNRTRRLKRYYENNDKLSNQQRIYYEKNREKNYYRKRTMDVYKLET